MIGELSQVVQRMKTVLAQYRMATTTLKGKCGNYELEISRLKQIMEKHGIVDEIKTTTGEEECNEDQQQ